MWRYFCWFYCLEVSGLDHWEMQEKTNLRYEWIRNNSVSVQRMIRMTVYKWVWFRNLFSHFSLVEINCRWINFQKFKRKPMLWFLPTFHATFRWYWLLFGASQFWFSSKWLPLLSSAFGCFACYFSCAFCFINFVGITFFIYFQIMKFLMLFLPFGVAQYDSYYDGDDLVPVEDRIGKAE